MLVTRYEIWRFVILGYWVHLGLGDWGGVLV